MPLTYEQFGRLSLMEQIAHIWQQGSFLAWRYHEQKPVGLYHLPGLFFCELYFEANSLGIRYLRSYPRHECPACFTDYSLHELLI